MVPGVNSRPCGKARGIRKPRLLEFISKLPLRFPLPFVLVLLLVVFFADEILESNPEPWRCIAATVKFTSKRAKSATHSMVAGLNVECASRMSQLLE